jgi:hypothetical protein
VGLFYLGKGSLNPFFLKNKFLHKKSPSLKAGAKILEIVEKKSL